MTVEIFRDDAYARTTEAQILAVSDDGIVLDQTVFYPEGGGQPGDRGSIILGDDSAITIVDTHKNQAGTLLHIPAAGQSMPAVNDHVTASIDWDYRYRHMRTHTCLHLLCALIPYDVTGGSISQAKGRLDFDMSDLLELELLDLSNLVDLPVIDIDVLDPAHASGTGTPEPGGLTPREVFPLVRVLCTENNLVGFELVELNPLVDPSYTTIMNANRLVQECLTGIAMRKSGITDGQYLNPLTVEDGVPDLSF